MVDHRNLSERLGVGDRTSGRSSDPVRRSLERFRRQVMRGAQIGMSGGLLGGLAGAAKFHPMASLERNNVEVIRDVPYLDGGSRDHTLDIYRPTVKRGPWPVVFYVHGGGFSVLSKETHWVMALIFARFGYLVFNISYRLAPKHPFPAALVDTFAAYEWMAEHAASYGGDLSRVVVAGESAGANLITALSVASCYRRPEPWAKKIYELDLVPNVAVPACGILQVSDTDRFSRRRKLPIWVRLIIGDVSRSYLRGLDEADPKAIELADPLVLLERGEPPDRPLPAFFAPVGTRDPLLDDTRRLKRALDALGVPVRARYYKGELHAFHVMVWRKHARQCWGETFAFLREHLPGTSSVRSVG